MRIIKDQDYRNNERGEKFEQLKSFYLAIKDDSVPYIVVDCSIDGVRVPTRYIKDQKIVLDISAQAVREFYLNNEKITFKATFAGIEYNINLPLESIITIYSSKTQTRIDFATTCKIKNAKHKQPQLRVVKGGLLKCKDEENET